MAFPILTQRSYVICLCKWVEECAKCVTNNKLISENTVKLTCIATAPHVAV